jgi:hypothetical protein
MAPQTEDQMGAEKCMAPYAFVDTSPTDEPINFWLARDAGINFAMRALCRKGFPEECNDLFVEGVMKRMPIESRIVGADLQSLFGQCFAAGRKERVVPRTSSYVVLGGLRKFLRD